MNAVKRLKMTIMFLLIEECNGLTMLYFVYICYANRNDQSPSVQGKQLIILINIILFELLFYINKMNNGKTNVSDMYHNYIKQTNHIYKHSNTQNIS